MTAPTDATLRSFLAGPNGLLAAIGEHFACWRGSLPINDALVVDIGIGEAADKDGVLGQFARGFDMPRWFGHNWDALADCLNDLEWLPQGPVVLLIEGNMSDSGAARTLVSILQDTCNAWQDCHRPFHVLIDRRLLAHA